MTAVPAPAPRKRRSEKKNGLNPGCLIWMAVSTVGLVVTATIGVFVALSVPDA